MNEKYARCGYRCDLCPAFEKNQRGPEDRQMISDGWKKYYNFQMDPVEIVCAGCCFEGHHLEDDCKVRPCAEARGYSTCAECPEYGSCDLLKKKVCAILPHKEQHGHSMPPEDYRLFIAPYESKVYLEQLRQKGRARHGRGHINRRSSGAARLTPTFAAHSEHLVEKHLSIQGGLPFAVASHGFETSAARQGHETQGLDGTESGKERFYWSGDRG